MLATMGRGCHFWATNVRPALLRPFSRYATDARSTRRFVIALSWPTGALKLATKFQPIVMAKLARLRKYARISTAHLRKQFAAMPPIGFGCIIAGSSRNPSDTSEERRRFQQSWLRALRPELNGSQCPLRANSQKTGAF